MRDRIVCASFTAMSSTTTCADKQTNWDVNVVDILDLRHRSENARCQVAQIHVVRLSFHQNEGRCPQQSP